MKKNIFQKKLNAFSFMEILFGMLIVGILTAMAIPYFESSVSRAKSLEAKLQLEHLHMLEKTYFFGYSKYSSSFSEIGFEQAKLATEGGTANYKIEITEAANTTFKATATAIADFDGDGIINVWTIDQDKSFKEVTPD